MIENAKDLAEEIATLLNLDTDLQDDKLTAFMDGLGLVVLVGGGIYSVAVGKVRQRD